MALTTCTSAAGFERAQSAQYRRIAKRVNWFLPRAGSRVVDLGGGRGQLSLPLAQIAKQSRIVVVDNYAGPYKGGKQRLGSSAKRLRLDDRITAIRSDATGWLTKQPSGGFDAIVSSELLPEMASTMLPGLFSSCQRCLRPGGATVHAFLSPIARNKRQALLIEADSDSRWTKHPPEEWFSPPPRLVVNSMKAAGLVGVKLERIKGNIVVRGGAARHLLQGFGVKATFWNTHEEFLTTAGLETPDWVIAIGRKLPRAR